MESAPTASQLDGKQRNSSDLNDSKLVNAYGLAAAGGAVAAGGLHIGAVASQCSAAHE